VKREVLVTVADDQHVSATSGAQMYMVSLLADFARPDHLSQAALSRPVTLQLAEAWESAGIERFEKLRLLGDGVLFASGFFGDHLENRGVELDYVRRLGARAYDGAACVLARGTPDGATDVLRELSENFVAFARLLNHVAEALAARSAPASPRGTLDLYERWLKSGSSALGRALADRGVVPTRGTRAVH
jgi:hypothetical protein